MGFFSEFSTGFKNGYKNRNSNYSSKKSSNIKKEDIWNYVIKIKWSGEKVVSINKNAETLISDIQKEGIASTKYNLFDYKYKKIGTLSCKPRHFNIACENVKLGTLRISGKGNEAKLKSDYKNIYTPIIKFDKGRYHIFSDNRRIACVEINNFLLADNIFFDSLSMEMDVIFMYLALKYIEDYQKYKNSFVDLHSE